MVRFEWDKLTHLQIGKYAEYLVKIEFTMCGFDVYSAEIDDKGIDFIIRRSPTKFFEIQVKSVRGYNYVFF
ncbi:MAG: hypothetical protein ACFE9L_16615 [Candidatus Hodarchaeota archaeon]